MKLIKVFSSILIVFLIVINPLKAQIGGTSTYRFLDLPNSAKVAALGGNNLTLKNEDVNLFHYNPALLNSNVNNNLALNYIPYFAGINWGYVAYSGNWNKIGNYGVGIHYINYGDFIAADEKGNKTGEFTASEYSFDLVWSKSIDSMWTVGINFKPIYSVLEKYTSFGFAVDLGVNYYNSDKLRSIGLVMKNIGTQIKPYYKNHYEKIPFDIQIGITQGLAHAPFKLSIVAQHLQKPNLNYDMPVDEGFTDIDGNENSEPGWYIKYPEMALRHCIFGLEFIPMKSFSVNIGYNHQRRQEMRIATKSGFTGFSWGISIYTKKFQIEYGRSRFHVAGASNLFSVKINFNEFIKKNNVVN